MNEQRPETTENPEISRWLNSMADDRNQMQEAYKAVSAKSQGHLACQGDRVLIASGLLGRGHLWVRDEAVVLETTQSACRVAYKNRKDHRTGNIVQEWVIRTLITDIVESKCEQSNSDSQG